MFEEEWKPILGFEGLYEVSDVGRIKSLDRLVVTEKRGNYSIPSSIMTPKKDVQGYLKICLRKDLKSHMFLTHRLVALAFIPNPTKYPQINHINGIKDDNRLENLEWCNNSMNQKHMIEVLKTHNTAGKINGTAPKCIKVDQIDKKTDQIIKTWPSIKEAIKAKAATKSVWRALKDNSKTCLGSKWRYHEK